MTVLKTRGRRIDPVAAPVLILHHELKNKSIIAKSNSNRRQLKKSIRKIKPSIHKYKFSCCDSE